MTSVEPKSISRMDSDEDFAASFVLNRGDVEDALATAEEQSSEATISERAPARSLKKWIYAGGAAVFLAVLLWIGVR